MRSESFFRVVALAERPDLVDEIDRVGSLPWPAFMHHDPIANRLWGRLYRDFAEYQFAVLDEGRDGAVVGVGQTVPMVWDGTPDGLLAGWDEAFERAVTDHDAGRAPNALMALSAALLPEYQGKGLSRTVLVGMHDLAARHGFHDLVAPVRPNRKCLYPLVPMSRYVTWTEPDGTPLDPWMRTHWRLGARVVGIAERSMVIPGTVAQWEEWAGMRFPESGEYVVPGALSLVSVDRERDSGVYVEPNVWMRHRLRGS